MAFSVRRTHHSLSYAMAAVFVFMATTGSVWAVCYRLLYYDKASLKWLIRFHQGDIFDIDSTGLLVKAPFCIAVMFGTCAMVLTGVYQLNQQSMRKNRNKLRMYHQWLALFAALPLLMLSITGGMWAMAKYVLLWKKEDIKWLILLHQGWFEIALPYFAPLVGVVVLCLVGNGLKLIFSELKKASKR